MALTDKSPSHLPKHVAIIMDGNGRWARKRLLPREAGHYAGMGAVRETVRSSNCISFAALSRRPRNFISAALRRA